MGIVKTTLKRSFLFEIVKYVRNRKIVRQKEKHDRDMLGFYSQLLSPGDLVFDVGANVGNRTNIFLNLGTKVIAVEPQEQCINVLNTQFGNNKNLTIVPNVLGSSSGEAELLISRANTISTLSTDWIAAVKSSGRFASYSWEDRMVVPMTTLDHLIESYGKPVLIKVDVEGFEHEVIAGLSQPIDYISLEFTPEFINSTFKCIDHLESLGNALFNYSIGESMQLALDKYVTSTEIKDILEGYRNNTNVFGDVYCHFIKDRL